MKPNPFPWSCCPRSIRDSLALCTALSLLGCHGFGIEQAFHGGTKGSGKRASEARKVADFHQIEFTGSGDVDYKIGSVRSVRVETDDNLLPQVETTVRNGKLTIGFKGSVSTKIGLHATVVAPACDSATLSGSGNLVLGGLKQRKFSATLTGSGHIAASGSADEVEALLSGSGDIDLSRLRTGDAQTEVSGSGTIKVSPTGALGARITGSGDIRYRGSPRSIQKEITGSGKVSSE